MFCTKKFNLFSSEHSQKLTTILAKNTCCLRQQSCAGSTNWLCTVWCSSSSSSSSKSVSTLLRRLFTIGQKVVVVVPGHCCFLSLIKIMKNNDYLNLRYFFFHAIIPIPFSKPMIILINHSFCNLFVQRILSFPAGVFFLCLFATTTNHLPYHFFIICHLKKKKLQAVCHMPSSLAIGRWWFYNGGIWKKLCNVK